MISNLFFLFQHKTRVFPYSSDTGTQMPFNLIQASSSLFPLPNESTTFMVQFSFRPYSASSAACFATSGLMNLLLAAIFTERALSGVGLRISKTETSALISRKTQLRTSTALRESTAGMVVSFKLKLGGGKGKVDELTAKGVQGLFCINLVRR